MDSLALPWCARLGDQCIVVTRQDLELTDTESIEPWVESTQPEVVINCAAYTAVDAAETDADTAWAVNGRAVGALAEATARHGIGFVSFSTDYVFDGEKPIGYVESDQPNPINVYGKTKLEGEQLALAAHPDALVIRTSWLLSATHHNFLTTMLQLLAKGPVEVVDDQRGRPTFVDDLVAGTLAAIEVGASGILHLTNQGVTTWYGLAREIAKVAGLDVDLVQSISSSALDRPARRPANSVLDSERMDLVGVGLLGHYLVSLPGALRAFEESRHDEHRGV